MLDYNKLRNDFNALLNTYSTEDITNCANRIERELRFEAISESIYENNILIECIEPSANFTNEEINKYSICSYNELAA